jgi:glycosyltransferase involved in cell wall biosynthesis
MKIGIITPLWERGISYVALNFIHALNEKHETGVLTFVSDIKNTARLNIRDEFDVPNLCVYPRTEILPDDLKRWLKPFDIVLFMEERLGNYLSVAKDMKKKTINYVCEPMGPSEVERMGEFDLVMSPSGVTGTEHVPLGVDINFFQPKERDKKKEDKVRVFVPLSWGGDYDRKNEKAIVAAVSRVQCRNRIEVLVHRQYGSHPGLLIDHEIKNITVVMPRNEMMETYTESDICVYYPKWGRSDLTVKEASACGTVVLGNTGVERVEKYEGVYTGGDIPDIHKLAVAIAELSENEKGLMQAKEEARQKALDLWDWEINKGKIGGGVLKMGCDYCADENGNFKLEIMDYKNSRVIDIIEIRDLEPNHPIQVECIVGEVR